MEHLEQNGQLYALVNKPKVKSLPHSLDGCSEYQEVNIDKVVALRYVHMYVCTYVRMFIHTDNIYYIITCMYAHSKVYMGVSFLAPPVS